MEKFSTIEEALDFAIKGEEEAVAFYSSLVDKVEREEIKGVFKNFVKEEEGHKLKLESVKNGKRSFVEKKVSGGLDISDYLVEEEVTSDMDYQSALVIAMEKEKAAYKLYTDLTAQTEDPEIAEVFRFLAQEEANHKLRFEIEYEENFMEDN